jgi:hypothetical protein
VTLSHVSNAILTVHNFVHQIICVSCVDDTVRAELWARLIEDLTTRYRRAMDHARFLLSVERVDYLSTVNPDFYRAFSDSDRAHAMEAAKKHMADMSVDEVVAGKTVKALMMLMLTQIMASGEKENGEEAMSRKIHDVLKNYYVISRSRFVDVVCKQAVEHFLLGADGPLRVLDERWVIDLPADLLDTITGEPLMDRTKRDELKKEIEGLVEAKKVVLK